MSHPERCLFPFYILISGNLTSVVVISHESYKLISVNNTITTSHVSEEKVSLTSLRNNKNCSNSPRPVVDSGNILFGLKKQQYVEYTLSFCKKIEKKLSNFERTLYDEGAKKRIG